MRDINFFEGQYSAIDCVVKASFTWNAIPYRKILNQETTLILQHPVHTGTEKH